MQKKRNKQYRVCDLRVSKGKEHPSPVRDLRCVKMVKTECEHDVTNNILCVKGGKEHVGNVQHIAPKAASQAGTSTATHPSNAAEGEIECQHDGTTNLLCI